MLQHGAKITHQLQESTVEHQSPSNFSVTNVCNSDKKQRYHLSDEYHFLATAFRTLNI